VACAVRALRRKRLSNEQQGVGQAAKDDLRGQPQHGEARRFKRPVPARLSAPRWRV